MRDMKEMVFYKDGNGATYARIEDKLFCFDANKFVDTVEKVTEYIDSNLLENFNSLIALAAAGALEDIEYTKEEIIEAKKDYMKSIFLMDSF